MSERWLPVGGWEALYEVSDLGRIRSLPRMGATRARNSLFNRVYGGAMLKPILKKATGYQCVTLRSPGNSKQVAVHRLVLEAFIGTAPHGFQACHNNGIRTDNRLLNLRWDSPAGNQSDRIKHGTDSNGSRNYNARLTEQDVLAIRASSEKQQALADRYGVTQVCISRIKLRKVWAHL